MEVSLSEADKLEIRRMIREEIASAMKQRPEWVSAREAAGILGISEDRLRRTKNRYEYRRAGGEDGRGRLIFRYESLISRYIGDEYE